VYLGLGFALSSFRLYAPEQRRSLVLVTEICLRRWWRIKFSKPYLWRWKYWTCSLRHIGRRTWENVSHGSLRGHFTNEDVSSRFIRNTGSYIPRMF